MKKIALLATVAAAILAMPAQAAEFKITVGGLSDGAKVPDANVFQGFGCTGKNLSPAISWTEPPEGTKSIAITMYDPDAPTGSGWWHWTVINLPAKAGTLAEGAGDAKGGGLPAGAVQGRTDFGTSNYGGPCPPVGDQPHHYIFTAYAVKADKIPLDANASGALVGFYINKGIGYTAKSSVTLLYGR
jgi:Raf kinase inhibitor-like YbhB/YbcL family protein